MNARNVDLTALVLGHKCRTLAFWQRALMNRPFEARVYLEHALVRTFPPAFDHPRWSEKLRVLEHVLGPN